MQMQLMSQCPRPNEPGAHHPEPAALDHVCYGAVSCAPRSEVRWHHKITVAAVVVFALVTALAAFTWVQGYELFATLGVSNAALRFKGAHAEPPAASGFGRSGHSPVSHTLLPRAVVVPQRSNARMLPMRSSLNPTPTDSAGGSVAHTRGAGALEDPQQSKGWRFFRSLGSPKLWLAPMVDQSELPFRMLCREYGVDGAYTPMLHARIFCSSKTYRKECFTTCPEDRPLLGQFCANDPDWLVEAAAYVQDYVDAVDLNLGCPQKIARQGFYGAFLMENITLIETIVRRAVAELKVPVTVKIRVFDDEARTLDYVRRLRDAGAYLIGVHGRTRDQKNSRDHRANWDIIKRIVEEFPDVPIIANGNIRDLKDVDECLRYTGAAAIMSAQSLLNDPMALQVPEESPDSPDRLILAMQRYLDLVEENPVPLRMVHGHMHSALGEWLGEFTDIREELNTIPNKKLRKKAVEALPQYRAVCQKLRERILEVYRTEGRTYPMPVKKRQYAFSS